MKDWEREEAHRELWSLINAVALVENIPMHKIEELCNAHVIDCYRFNSTWLKLVDECHKIIGVAEERMEAFCDEY